MSVERIRPTDQDAWLDLTDTMRWARVDGDYEVADFARMIDAVAREAEDYAQIALLDQTIRILLPFWPPGHVRLPIVPILDRDSISVTINAQTWADVQLGGGSRPLLIICGNAPAGVVVIEYQAGFGADPASIPADIRQALTDQVAVYYDTRGPADAKAVSLSAHFARILGRYRGVGL